MPPCGQIFPENRDVPLSAEMEPATQSAQKISWEGIPNIPILVHILILVQILIFVNVLSLKTVNGKTANDVRFGMLQRPYAAKAKPVVKHEHFLFRATSYLPGTNPRK